MRGCKGIRQRVKMKGREVRQEGRDEMKKWEKAKGKEKK